MPPVNLHNTNKHNHRTIKIGVSGSADMSFLSEDAYEKAKEVGRQIALQGGVMTSGATTGFPFWAAMGSKSEKGISIGFSPASSEREHVDVYRLPLDYMDVIIYTGFGYCGRDLLFTRSSDAVIIGPGRIGTYHEFTITYEDNKPVGILQAEDLWDTDKIIQMMMEKSHRQNPNVIFDKDPARLVERLMEMVQKNKDKLYAYNNNDGVGGMKGTRIL